MVSLKKKDSEKELSKIPWVTLGQNLVWGKSHEIQIFNRILNLKDAVIEIQNLIDKLNHNL